MSSLLRYILEWTLRLLPTSASSLLRRVLTPIVSHVAQWNTLSLQSKRSMALSLPDEIWALIVTELDLKDIVNARLTCRYLHHICQNRMAWRQIFLSFLGSELPEPFLLAKPFQECSAGDLESTIKRWKVGWTPTVPLRHFNRQVDKSKLEGQRLDYESVLVLPGGRWAIAASITGSVWWFDLSDDWTFTAPAEPRILIPSTLTVPEGSNERMRVVFAVDFFSEEALGGSIHDHYLSQINIAVITRRAYIQLPKPSDLSLARIGVWRVNVSKESGGSLVLGDCLSTFTDTGIAKLADISLYGTTVAYYGKFPGGHLSDTGCVVIVEWPGADEKIRDGEMMRRYIHFPTQKSILLPRGRILLVHEDDRADLHNWRKNYQPSTLPPSEWGSDHYKSPTWGYYLRRGDPLISEAMPHPLLFSDTIRLVLPATYKIFGVTIPLEDDAEDATKIEMLCQGRWNGHHLMQVFGYRQAAGTRDHGASVFGARYEWLGMSPACRDAPMIDEDTERFAEVKLPDGTFKGDRRDRFVTRYDQYSQRIMLLDDIFSQFVTLG